MEWVGRLNRKPTGLYGGSGNLSREVWNLNEGVGTAFGLSTCGSCGSVGGSDHVSSYKKKHFGVSGNPYWGPSS